MNDVVVYLNCIEINKELFLTHIKKSPELLKYIKQDDDICMAAIELNTDVLQYIKIQTRDMCLKAVNKNGLALQHVKEQPCIVCKDKTNYIDYCLESRVCSKECYKELTERIIIGRRDAKYNTTMNKIKNILGVE